MADDLFGGVLTDIADGPRVSEQGGLTAALMTRLHEKGLSLEELGGPKIMARSKRTLQAHARELGLAFKDYVPMAQRRKITLFQKGDFYELYGSCAADAAALFDIVLLGKADDPMCAFPAHTIDEAKAKLKANWYVVKIVKAKKPRAKKAVKNV